MELRRSNADETSLYAHVWQKISSLLLATRAKQDESGKSLSSSHGISALTSIHLGMQPDAYAEKLLNQVLKPSPPAYYYLASYVIVDSLFESRSLHDRYSLLFPFLGHFPAWFVDTVAARIWHQKEVSYNQKKRL